MEKLKNPTSDKKRDNGPFSRWRQVIKSNQLLSKFYFGFDFITLNELIDIVYKYFQQFLEPRPNELTAMKLFGNKHLTRIKVEGRNLHIYE